MYVDSLKRYISIIVHREVCASFVNLATHKAFKCGRQLSPHSANTTVKSHRGITFSQRFPFLFRINGFVVVIVNVDPKECGLSF